MSGSKMCHEENLSSIIEKWFQFSDHLQESLKRNPLWGNDIRGTAVE